MSSTIQTDYRSREIYGQTAGKRNTGRKGSASVSFQALAARTGQADPAGTEYGVHTGANDGNNYGIHTGANDGIDYGVPMGANVDSDYNVYMRGAAGTAIASIETYRSSMVSSASGLHAGEAASVQPPTLEEMLKAKYPGIKYHVFDASSSYWKTRHDYPHYLLYQDQIDTDAIENWKPSGPNPPYTPFEASREIRALGAVPPGSKAVVIHPKVQARMEEDPEYAKEIMERIDTWFTFDAVRNEAILPGSAAGMSQAVAIGEDGSIVNAVSSSQPRLTRSSSGDEEDWWEIRKARHAYYMSLITEKQLQHRLMITDLSSGSPSSAGADSLFSSFSGAGSLLSDLGGIGSLMDSLSSSGSLSAGLADYNSSQAAKAQLAEMMKGNRLQEIFGPTLGGNPTESVLEHTRKLVWG